MSRRESHSSDLRQALLALTDAEFELLVDAALEELTGQHFYRADSGRQDGGDGASNTAFNIVYECKRYSASSLPLDALLGKFVMASHRDPPPDLWILAATRDVPDQRVRALQREAEAKGVSLLVLDMPRDRLGSLAVLCAAAPRASAHYMPGAAQLLTAVRTDPTFEAVLARLTGSLDAAESTFQAMRAGMAQWLRSVLSDAEILRVRLQVRLPSTTQSDPWSGFVTRQPLSDGFAAWLQGPEDRVFCVCGDEGVGKSLATYERLRSEFDQRLVIAISRNAEVTADPFDLMARALRQALGGEASRWRRKLEFLLQRDGQGPTILLYLDGIDERSSEPWEPLLRRLEDDPFKGRVAVVISVRPSPLKTRLRDLRFLAIRPVELPIGLFSPEELSTALAKRRLKPSRFSTEMLALMRRPRLFDLALKHRARLEAAGEFTAARLYWEDWDDRVARGRPIASGETFRLALRQLAKELDAARLALPPSALMQAFAAASPFDPQPETDRQSLSELVDGGLAHLDGEEVKIDPGFAAFALGYDLAERLAAIAAKGGSVEEVADHVRAILEPWGGADFDAEVVRAAAWARLLTAGQMDLALQALLIVWLERKNLPAGHEEDLVSLTRAAPHLLLPAAEALWVGDDFGASGRVEELLAAHAADPALRPRLIAAARRWICEIGLMDYPFLGQNTDTQGYRQKRLASVTDLLGGEPAFERPFQIAGETVIFHEGERPDGSQAFKRALVMLRAGGADDLWPLVRAWAVTTSLRYHDDLGTFVASVLRSVEAGAALDVQARRQLALWACSETPTDMAAARALSWALGDPEARRIAEPALVKSGFVAKRDQELKSGGRFSPETLEEARTTLADKPGRGGIRWCGAWLLDPELELGPQIVAEAVERISKLGSDEMLAATSTTESSLELEELTPVLARAAPKALADWVRGFARAASVSDGAGANIYRRHVIYDFAVLGQPELAEFAATNGDSRSADDLRLSAALALRDGDEQIAFLLSATLPEIVGVHIADEARAPSAVGVERLEAALDKGFDEDLRLIVILHHLVAARAVIDDGLATRLLALIDHPSTLVRAQAYRLLAADHAEAGARKLHALKWTAASAESEKEAWSGSYLLAKGNAPLDWVLGAVHPRHAIMAGLGEPDLVAGLIEAKLARIARARTDLAREEPSSGSHLALERERFRAALHGPKPREDAIPAARLVVAAHEEALQAADRRPDWRLRTDDLAKAWREQPAPFNRLTTTLLGLDDVQLGDAIHAQAGLVLPVVEAGLAVAPDQFGDLWRRIPEAVGSIRHPTVLVTDWVATMPFRVAPELADPDLLQACLDRATTDAELLDCVLCADRYGHVAWLDGAIEADLASPTTWRRARGLMLQGFLGRPLPNLDPFYRLDARASWLSSVAATAEAHRRRKLRLDHWFDAFERARTPDEVFAAYELVKGSASRWIHLAFHRSCLGDLQQRHVTRQHPELKRSLEKAEKKLGEKFLGDKIIPGVWPANSKPLPSSEPF